MRQGFAHALLYPTRISLVTSGRLSALIPQLHPWWHCFGRSSFIQMGHNFFGVNFTLNLGNNSIVNGNGCRDAAVLRWSISGERDKFQYQATVNDAQEDCSRVKRMKCRGI